MPKPDQIETNLNESHRWRTLLHVQRIIGSDPRTARVQCLIPGLDSKRRLTMQFNSLPEQVRSGIGVDTILFAKVNFAASKSSELNPSNIELGPTNAELDQVFANDPYLAWLNNNPEQLYPHGFWEEDKWGTGLMYRKYPDGRIHEIVRTDPVKPQE